MVVVEVGQGTLGVGRWGKMIGKKLQWEAMIYKPSKQGKIKLQKFQFRTAPNMMSGSCFVVGCRYQQ